MKYCYLVIHAQIILWYILGPYCVRTCTVQLQIQWCVSRLSFIDILLDKIYFSYIYSMMVPLLCTLQVPKATLKWLPFLYLKVQQWTTRPRYIGRSQQSCIVIFITLLLIKVATCIYYDDSRKMNSCQTSQYSHHQLLHLYEELSIGAKMSVGRQWVEVSALKFYGLFQARPRIVPFLQQFDCWGVINTMYVCKHELNFSHYMKLLCSY